MSRSDSPTLGFPLSLPPNDDPLIHPDPFFTRALPLHDPTLFDLDILPSISRRSPLPPFASPTRRQSRFPSFSSALGSRNAIYFPHLSSPTTTPTLSPASSASSSSPDVDYHFPVPPLDTNPKLSSDDTTDTSPPPPHSSRPSSILSLAALAAHTRVFLSLSDNPPVPDQPPTPTEPGTPATFETSASSHASLSTPASITSITTTAATSSTSIGTSRSPSLENGIPVDKNLIIRTRENPADVQARLQDYDSHWSHSAASLHELAASLSDKEKRLTNGSVEGGKRKRLRSFISRLSATATSSSPTSPSAVEPRSSASASVSTITITSARTAPSTPLLRTDFGSGRSSGSTESCPTSPRGMSAARSLSDTPSVRSLTVDTTGKLHSNSTSTPNPTRPTTSSTPKPLQGSAIDPRPWYRKGGGGGRRAYVPTPPIPKVPRPTSSRSTRSTTRTTGAPSVFSAAAGPGIGVGGGGMGLGLTLGAVSGRSRSRLSLLSFGKEREGVGNKEKGNVLDGVTDIDKNGAVKGKSKRMLVVSGLAPNDMLGFQAVRVWCEEFGEVQSILRKENGTLHVEFRKWSVANTVCRVQAQVHIKGAGSVSLSWYSGKKSS